LLKTDLQDLKRKSVRGGTVTMVSQAISIAIQLTSTVILARLLSPQDYGVIAMVMAVTAFAGVFRDLGLSAAAIQKKDLTRDQQSNLFWLNVAVGALLTAIVSAASPLVVWFYGEPELLWVTVALSFNFLIGSLGSQHGAMLVRNMQFGRNAIPGISGALVSLGASVILAIKGWSYWSLVWGNLSGALVTTVLMLALSPFRPHWMQRDSGTREMLNFGANVTAFEFVNYFQRNLDNILIGRFWGPGPLGLYSRAYSLLMLPITSIRGPINAVAFPALSRLQNEPDAFRNYYLKVTSLIALLSMPLAAFLFVTSAPLVQVLLGKQWLEVAPIFSWLALAAFIQPASGFAGSLLLSLGQGRRYLTCGLFNGIILSLCFVIGVQWGPKGVAIAYTIGNYIVLYPWLFYAFQESPVRFSMFAKACVFPVTVSILGVVTVLFSQQFYAIQNSFAQLVAASVVFGATALSLCLLTPQGKKHLQVLKTLLNRN
jgi:PST family polysaccharide transporter